MWGQVRRADVTNPSVAPGYIANAALKGHTPIAIRESRRASLKSCRWQRHCRGLYQTPMAAWVRSRHAQAESLCDPTT